METRKEFLANVSGVAFVAGVALITQSQSVREFVLPPGAQHSVGFFFDGAINWAIFASILPLRIMMPCGEKLELRNIDTVPRHTVRCPCGDPTHFLVEWKQA